MSDNDPNAYAAEIHTLIEQRLRIKGASLTQQIHKTGRRLPRKVKRDANIVAQAAMMAGHPKLVRQIDHVAVANAGSAVVAHLEAINPTEVLKDRILWTLGKISAVVIIVFVAVVWVAHSRGMI